MLSNKAYQIRFYVLNLLIDLRFWVLIVNYTGKIRFVILVQIFTQLYIYEKLNKYPFKMFYRIALLKHFAKFIGK